MNIVIDEESFLKYAQELNDTMTEIAYELGSPLGQGDIKGLLSAVKIEIASTLLQLQRLYVYVGALSETLSPNQADEFKPVGEDFTPSSNNEE